MCVARLAGLLATSGILIAALLAAFAAGCATGQSTTRSRGPVRSAARSAHPQRTAATRARRASSLTPAVASEYRTLTSEIVHGYASSGERHYADGVWENGDPSCWYCNVGPAVGAAYLSGAEPGLRQIAVASMDHAIAAYHQTDGSVAGGSISGAVFAIMLGLTYVQLAPELDQPTRALWEQSLAGIADYMMASRDATWYANGNINSSYAATFYFAWRATGQQKYLEAYNAELQFMVAPTGHLWEGFGLIVTQQPTTADGSDGRGFLTEGSPPGWDPEYSHLQLDFLSALYSASGDPRVRRLLNLILNQELTRTNTTTFILDARGGTRKNDTMAFTSAALPLLVLDGSRPDLAPLLPAAFARLSSEYRATLKYSQHNFYRGVALWLSPVLLATSGQPWVVAPATPANPTSVGPTPTPTPTPRSSARVGPLQAVRPAEGAASTAGGQMPTISPRALGASQLQEVADLNIPGVEYAFAAPSALTKGVVASGASPRGATFAGFACTRPCELSVRPLLVIHSGGENTPVIVQTNLRETRATLRAGQVYVSRVVVPHSALRDAQKGHTTFIRLRMTVLTTGEALQGRSHFFKVAARLQPSSL